MTDNQIELEVSPGAGPGDYTVRVVRSLSGAEPEVRVRIDVDGLNEGRRGLQNAVLASAARTRGAVPEAEAPLRRAGLQLFRTLFGGAVGDAYRASGAVARDRDQRLRLVLRLTAPELAVLPWEALFDPESNTYLCMEDPLVRHVPAPFTPEPLPVQPPLRVLGLIAAPRGLPGLNTEAEQRNMHEALKHPIAQGLITLEWLAQASWDGIQDQLLSHQWHVLHFVGHGDYDPETDQGLLALVDQDQQADWVDASRLADLLREAEPTPRLVVLNSCSSGRSGASDTFSGTAATLVHRGISAVVAMQFPISDRAAVAFPKGFYNALATGRSVDQAVRSGRVSIRGVRYSLEWVTPVLYLRGDAARLFAFTGSGTAAPATGRLERVAPQDEPDAEPRRSEQPNADLPRSTHGQPLQGAAPHSDVTQDPAYVEALADYFTGRWDEAVEHLAALIQRYPDEERVRNRLDSAQRERDLSNASAAANRAEESDDWPAVVRELKRVLVLDPSFPDAAARLARARTERRKHELWEEMRALNEAGHWSAVLAMGDEFTELDPDDGRVRALVAHAGEQLAEATLAETYTKALRHLDDEDWHAAVELFDTIEQQRSGFRDAHSLSRSARQHLHRQHGGRQPLPPSDSVTARVARRSGAKPTSGVPVPMPRPYDGVREGTVTRWLKQVGDDMDEDEPLLEISADNVVTEVFSPAAGVLDRIFVQEGQTVAIGVELALVRARASRVPRAARPGISMSWQDATTRRLMPTGGTLSGICCLAWLSSERVVAVATTSASVQAYELSGDKATPLKDTVFKGAGFFSSVTSVAFSAAAGRLATGASNGMARVFDASSGTRVHELRHAGAVHSVTFNNSGTRLATACADGMVRTWDVETGRKQLEAQHVRAVHSVAFASDGVSVAGAGEDGTVLSWNPSGQSVLKIEAGGSLAALAFDVQGSRLATASTDGRACVWTVGSGQLVAELPHGGAVNDVGWDPTGTVLITASDDGSARVWDLTQRREELRVNHEAAVISASFSPGGKVAVTATRDQLRLVTH